MCETFFIMQRSVILSCNAEVVVDREYVPTFCNLVPGHRRAWRKAGPITIDIVESDTADCLWTFMSDCLLIDTVIQELNSIGITGFATDVVQNKGTRSVNRSYCQFKPIGWGGFAKPSSGVKETFYCPSCSYRKYSSLLNPQELFDHTQWDGTDVFMIWPLPKFIFISSRMARAIKDLRVTGIEVVPIAELDTIKSGFTPGRLSHYMPPEIVQKLGDF